MIPQLKYNNIINKLDHWDLSQCMYTKADKCNNNMDLPQEFTYA